jgi:hypothetical protein
MIKPLCCGIPIGLTPGNQGGEIVELGPIRCLDGVWPAGRDQRFELCPQLGSGKTALYIVLQRTRERLL